MHWGNLLAGTVLSVLGLLVCMNAFNSLSQARNAYHHHSPPSVEAFHELAELTVLDVEVNEIATGSIRGRAGSTTAIVLVTGTVTLGVDLEQAVVIEANETQKIIVLSLPPPIVRRVSIDHDASQVLSCERSGLWELAVGDAHEAQAVERAFAIGQERLRHTGASIKHTMMRARRQTESILTDFAAELNWMLDIHWQE